MDGWNVCPSNWENNSNSYEIEDIKLDLIIVLAGGLNSEGMVHPWVKRRLNRAVELHKIHDFVPILCCGGGTYHKPPFLNDKQYVIHESTECANYLIQKGVNPVNILREWSSYDTIANGFFSLTTHVWCRNWKNIGVVTSKFHMPRSKAIFDWVYNLSETKYNLFYYRVSDKGIDESIINDRKAREKQSLQNVIKLSTEITTINQLHQWLFTKHNAYNNQPIIHETINCSGSY